MADYNPIWREWSRSADTRYLTNAQRFAVRLIEAGLADSPEAALRMLENREGPE